MKKSLTMSVLKLENLIKDAFSGMANDVKLLDKDLSAKLKQIFYFVSDTKKKLEKRNTTEKKSMKTQWNLMSF